VEEFTSDECNSDDCNKGGHISFVPLEEGTAPKVDIASWVLPVNGFFELGNGLTIELHENNEPADIRLRLVECTSHLTQHSMVERSATWQDFNCHNNWVLDGTNVNPEYRFPCSRDTAVFPFEGRASFSVRVPPNTYVDAIRGNDMTDGTQFSTAAVDIHAGTRCPKPFSLDTNTSYCAAWCVSSCPTEGLPEDKAKANVLKGSRDAIALVEDALAVGERRLNESSRIVTASGVVSFDSLLNEKSADVVNAVALAFESLTPFTWMVWCFA
jgi:hypothetical protein